MPPGSGFVPFPRFRKFSDTTFLNKISASLSLYSPSGIPINANFVTFYDVTKFSVFTYYYFFFSLVQLDCYYSALQVTESFFCFL